MLLCGATTPLVLDDMGPALRDSDLVNFEERLGQRLPEAYREFLLSYNGGDPVSGEVLGRDDDPNVPYAYGDSVRVLFKLPAKEHSVADYERLMLPREHPWEFPDDLLPIGEDAGGNIFGMELGERGRAVRFIDHERLDEPIETHRVLADDFFDFVQRFKSVEVKEAEDNARREQERRALEHGPFPSALEDQCAHLRESFPDLRAWIRTACLRVFESKGYFALHADEDSRTVFDIFGWLSWAAAGRALRDPRHATEALIADWWAHTPERLGIRGIAPDFVEAWWNDRTSRGQLREAEGGLRFSDLAIEELVAKLSSPGAGSV